MAFTKPAFSIVASQNKFYLSCIKSCFLPQFNQSHTICSIPSPLSLQLRIAVVGFLNSSVLGSIGWQSLPLQTCSLLNKNQLNNAALLSQMTVLHGSCLRPHVWDSLFSQLLIGWQIHAAFKWWWKAGPSGISLIHVLFQSYWVIWA